MTILLREFEFILELISLKCHENTIMEYCLLLHFIVYVTYELNVKSCDLVLC